MPTTGQVLYVDFPTPPPTLESSEDDQKVIVNARNSGKTLEFPIPRERPERVLANFLEGGNMRPKSWKTQVYVTRGRKRYTEPPAKLALSIRLLEPQRLDETVVVARPRMEIFGRDKLFLNCNLLGMRLFPGSPETSPGPGRLVVSFEIGSYLLNGSADAAVPTKIVWGAVFNFDRKRIVVLNQDFDGEAGDLCCR